MSPGGTLSVRLEVHRGLGYGGEAQVLLVEELPQPGVLQMMGPGHATAAGGDATAAAAAAAADTAGTSSSSAAAAAAVEGSLLCALKITRPWEWMVEMYEKEHPGCSIPVTQEQYLQHCQQTMQKEFDLLSKCKGSPHIVQAYYVGVVHVHGYGSLPALLMEYCAGGCLTDYLARCFEFYKTGLSYEDARHIMNSTYTAMCGFHEKGIGHRDLKSHNVLLTKWPPLQPGQPPLPLSEMGEVRVSDLGLAWEFKPGVPCRLTTSTPDYRPPELDSGRASDLTADSWAFGCLLLSARTAQRPFPHLPVGDARRGPGELDNPQGPYHDLLKPDEKALLRELLEQRGQRKILSDVADGHPAYFAEAASYR
jgi:serine/threonine protein kinase